MSDTSHGKWQVPEHIIHRLNGARSRYCVCIPVINEGAKLRKQLDRMQDVLANFDVIIADGGSSDGSTDHDFLRSVGVNALLVKTGPGRLGAQLRMAFAYAVAQGYEGVITIDGNNKDSVESVFQFVAALKEGYDFVQGSRFVSGGEAINTPMSRLLAIRLIHAPFISFLSKFHYTDTTNGFRAMSRKFLLDPRVSVFRDVFQTYELLAYLSVKAPTLGFAVKEIPVTRKYPESGKIPTKISPFHGNLLLLRTLVNLALGKYNPINQ